MFGRNSPTVKHARRGTVRSMREEFRGVILFIAVIWLVFLLSRFFPAINEWGLVPRRLRGLAGIASMSFLHLNFAHIAENTIPLFVLLSLLAGARGSSLSIVVMIISVGGSLLWLFGMRGNHIGASLLIFGLITFFIVTGLLIEKRPVAVVIALLVGFLYGIPLIRGVLPIQVPNVSWDGHLCGAIAGVMVAYAVGRHTQLAERPVPRHHRTSAR